MITVHVGPRGYSYHLGRECIVMAGGEYERLGYSAVEVPDFTTPPYPDLKVKGRWRTPCPWCGYPEGTWLGRVLSARERVFSAPPRTGLGHNMGKSSVRTVIIHVRPNGLAYHLKRECGMLAGDQYERLHYKAFEIAEPQGPEYAIVLNGREYFPCPGCSIKGAPVMRNISGYQQG
jgi:hypothetical protein